MSKYNNNYIKIGIFLTIIVIVVIILIMVNEKKSTVAQINIKSPNGEQTIETFQMFNGSYIPDVPKHQRNFQFNGKCTYTAFPKDYEKNYLGWRKFLTKNDVINATQKKTN